MMMVPLFRNETVARYFGTSDSKICNIQHLPPIYDQNKFQLYVLLSNEHSPQPLRENTSAI